MADPRAHLHVRQVVLSWAQPETPRDIQLQVGQQLLQRRAAAQKVSAQHVHVGGLEVGTGAPGRAGRASEPLGFDGAVPFRPLPVLAPEDCLELDTADLLGAVVALDVLTTRTRRLQADPTVLADLTAVLVEVGRLGGLGGDDLERLLAHAEHEAGPARAVLSTRMATCLQGSDCTNEPTVHASTPEGVATALRQIEAATELCIREVRLRLAAQHAADYWRLG